MTDCFRFQSKLASGHGHVTYGPAGQRILLWIHPLDLGRLTLTYRFFNALLDRDGRVISCHIPAGNGSLTAKAPADAERDRAVGVIGGTIRAVCAIRSHFAFPAAR
jgi:hypothetical protein